MLVDEEDMQNNKSNGLNELIEYDANAMIKAEPRRQDFKSATILKKYYDSEMDNIFPTPQNQKQLTEDSMGDDFNSSNILPNISITPRRRNIDGVSLEMTSKSNLWNAQIVPETLDINEVYEPPESSTRDLKFYTNRNMEQQSKKVQEKSKLMMMNQKIVSRRKLSNKVAVGAASSAQINTLKNKSKAVTDVEVEDF